jgi:hypothetical protein
VEAPVGFQALILLWFSFAMRIGFPVFQVDGYGTENIPFDPDAAITEDSY